MQQLNQKTIKKAAIITSCLSKRQKQEDIRKILTDKNVEVVDDFICRGGLLFLYMRHPNKKEINEAIEFTSKIIEANI